MGGPVSGWVRMELVGKDHLYLSTIVCESLLCNIGRASKHVILVTYLHHVQRMFRSIGIDTPRLFNTYSVFFIISQKKEESDVPVVEPARPAEEQPQAADGEDAKKSDEAEAKTEEPKTEEPKAEEPKTEEPKAETEDPKPAEDGEVKSKEESPVVVVSDESADKNAKTESQPTMDKAAKPADDSQQNGNVGIFGCSKRIRYNTTPSQQQIRILYPSCKVTIQIDAQQLINIHISPVCRKYSISCSN